MLCNPHHFTGMIKSWPCRPTEREEEWMYGGCREIESEFHMTSFQSQRRENSVDRNRVDRKCWPLDTFFSVSHLLSAHVGNFTQLYVSVCKTPKFGLKFFFLTAGRKEQVWDEHTKAVSNFYFLILIMKYDSCPLFSTIMHQKSILIIILVIVIDSITYL